MPTQVRVWLGTVVLIITLVTAVAAAPGRRAGPGMPSAFLVKDINGTFDTAADSSPGPFVEAEGNTVLFRATSGLWRTDGTRAGTALIKSVGVSGLTRGVGTVFFGSASHPSMTAP